MNYGKSIPNLAPTYLIVGASGEIGAQIAQRTFNKGAKIFLTHSENSSPNDYYPETDTVQWAGVNVSDSKSVNSYIDQIEPLITRPLKFIYCAGILDDHPIANISDESWKCLIDVNLSGAFYFLRRLFRTLALDNNGRVLLIGSISSKKAAVGQAAYASSKAGLEALSRIAALELGRFGVTCNTISPGAVESSMFKQTRDDVVQRIVKNTPLKKLGSASDVADLANFLLSDQSSHITGQTFYIDGGATIT